MPTNQTDLGTLTVLDWLGGVWIGFAILGLIMFPVVASFFHSTYADFGDVDLPVLTVFVTQLWVAPVLALVPFALLTHGLRVKVELNRRRFLLVVTGVIATVLLAVCFIGVYLPLFDLAEVVNAE